jgi:TatD DNase family protein
MNFYRHPNKDWAGAPVCRLPALDTACILARMKLFDAHCHLQDEILFQNLGNVMGRAKDADVEKLVCAGTSPADWPRVAEITARFPHETVSAFGLHPWFVKGRDGSPSRPNKAARPDFGELSRAAVEPCQKDIQTLKTRLIENPAAGLGETGLDFSSFAEAAADRHERFTNRAEQEASFAMHLDLARELNRPVTVHCVHAWGRLIEILREHPAPRVLLHAFGGAPELIPELAELNCWFSFCGLVTRPTAKRVRASAAAVPAERLLIETDSPDFPPPGCPSPNEPANLIHVARAIAELRGISVEETARITSLNAQHFFGFI